MTNAANQLEATRLELLDMGLRGNPLLSFRHSTAKSLEIVDEYSQQIFDTLVIKNRNMSFAPLPDSLLAPEQDNTKIEPARIVGQADLFSEQMVRSSKSKRSPSLDEVKETLSNLHGKKRHLDNILQTRLDADHLDKRLLKIQTEANTYFQEQGIDILYLALGFITWYESDGSDKPRKAPLVLVPVSLERGSAQERFKLRYTEAELGPNLTLMEKFRGEFAVELPGFEELEDIEDYISQVQQSVLKKKRWHVELNEIALGFFSFGKFQMYQDLNKDNWPKDQQPDENEIIKSLFDGGFEHVLDGDDSPLYFEQKQHISQKIEQLALVKDSDSSQSEAVIAVKQGGNLVIQGPPGTGKSQTITNIISQALADNKTVLFVSEKMAALEVVKRRLDETNIGGAVLELHSHKSNKKAVLDSLRETLEQGRPQSPQRYGEHQRLLKYRELLDGYCNQVNQPILNTSISYISALGKTLSLSEQCTGYSEPEFDFTPMEKWSDIEYADRLELVNTLVKHLQEMGRPSNSPFSRSKLRDYSPVEQQKVTNQVSAVRINLDFLRECGKEITDIMQLPLPKNVSDCRVIVEAAKRAMQAPDLGGLNINTNEWQTQRDVIRDLLFNGKKIHGCKERQGSKFIDAIWEADLLSCRSTIASKGQSIWRFFSSEYRCAKSLLAGFCKNGLEGKPSDWVKQLDDILDYQKAKAQFEQHALIGEMLFASQWQGLKSDWEVLAKLFDWVVETWQAINDKKVPLGIIAFLQGSNDLKKHQEVIEKLNNTCEAFAIPLIDLYGQLGFEYEQKDLFQDELEDIAKALTDFEMKTDAMYLMTRFNRLSDKLTSAGIGFVAQTAFDSEHDPSLIRLGFELSWYRGLANHAYKTHDAIRQFDRTSHEYALSEFRDLDASLFHFAQEELVEQLYQRLPVQHAGGEVGILRTEFNKKRRHLAIRRLLSKAGRAVQEIKPIFMMSPMSVATYLEPGFVNFDLVIFDEASQVKVADALGAIIRGKQVVVVGDTKQMPPTDFFGKSVVLDDEDAEESSTADMESILGLFLAKGAPEKMLRWHYRSRHESLIAVSNQEFYDNKLMIFPSPGVNTAAQGLSLHHNPLALYDRGGSRTNPQEAQDVVAAVLEHAKNSAHLTLGVVAFSTAQRDAILNYLEVARRNNPEVEEFFTEGNQNEVFFVKNLENVQGDERDVIFISLGYGRTSSGNMSQSFGPLNRQGGERRLNVLISRARMAMHVFSNFTADDLQTSSESPFGVRSLKNFLYFAQSGELQLRQETGKEPDSPFEEQVISAIRSLGYDIEPQVGCSGFFIDIAVVDPTKKGRYVLAVECDGASYHSSATARDRDRIRQNVLEDLGWRFHRIWSTDWFRNAHKETLRLKQSIDDAVAFYKAYDQGQLQHVVKNDVKDKKAASIDRVDVPEVSGYAQEYERFNPADFPTNYDKDLYTVSSKSLADGIERLVLKESPVHIKRVTQVVLEVYGIARSGAKVKRIVDSATQYAVLHYGLRLSGDFLSHRESELCVRNRANLLASERKLDFVSDAEIELSIMQAVEVSFSLNEDEAIAMALDSLGFNRATSATKQRFLSIIAGLIKSKRLKTERGTLVVVDDIAVS